MQTEYYHSPCPQQSADRDTTKKRRKWPALVIFSTLIVLFFGGLVTLRIINPTGPLFSWETLIPQLEGSFDFEFPDGMLPEGSQDTVPGEAPVQQPGSTVKPSLPLAPTAPDVELILSPPGEEMTFQDIYTKVIPSIVHIEVSGESGLSAGTGVIMTRDGYIVTNHHIIADRSKGLVVLSDGREFEARLVGSDVESDLAVLKITAKGLIPAQFGSSEHLRVGDTVVAIGNPLGSELFGTMTEGIVSAIDRDVTVDGYTMSLIQTTAALNPGNSGGALINTAGQVVGITNLKMMSDYETIEGLGFAIPTVWAKEVVDILLDQGKITGRPTIGITCFALFDGAAPYYGRDSGIYVESVVAGSPGDKAGLQPGDIILTANGQEVTTLDEFTAVRDVVGVGGVMELVVWRDGETFETELTLAEQYEVH